MDMTAQLNDAFGKAVQGAMMQNPGMTQAAVMAQFAGLGIDSRIQEISLLSDFFFESFYSRKCYACS